MTAYEDDVLGLLGGHGGEVLHRWSAADPAGPGPHEVQLLRFPAPSAVSTFLADGRRTSLGPRRDRAIARTLAFPVRGVGQARPV